jgi:hypothetical protein
VVVGGEVVRDAGNAAVHVGATQILGTNHLPGSGLHLLCMVGKTRMVDIAAAGWSAGCGIAGKPPPPFHPPPLGCRRGAFNAPHPRTSGGPPRKMVPVPCTITLSSDMAGT